MKRALKISLLDPNCQLTIRKLPCLAIGLEEFPPFEFPAELYGDQSKRYDGDRSN
jgi:hypothetical protein